MASEDVAVVSRHDRHNRSIHQHATCSYCEFDVQGAMAVALAERHFALSGHRVKVTIEESYTLTQ